MTEQSVWKQRLPFISTLLLLTITLYLMTYIWSKVASLIATQYQQQDVRYGSLLYGSGDTVALFVLFIAGVLSIFTWLLSTRVTLFKRPAMRIGVFLLAVLTIWGAIALYGMMIVRRDIIPFFEGRLSQVIETNTFFEQIVFDHTTGFYLMVLAMPLMLMFFITLFLLTKFVQFEHELREPFLTFEWGGKWLQTFSKLENKNYKPDIVLGENSKTKEMVVLPGNDRTLNSMIVGPIGTGKTAALAMPVLNQDLHHMVKFINEYPQLRAREDYWTEDVVGRYLNGISVIDPSNDLCQKVLKLAKAHGVPDEAITYINPLDPNTPSLNAMRGPVDKVAEIFAQVIAGLNDSGDGGNFFFEQAQRTHLKQHIYLLKLHDPDLDVIFDMLLDMYNNPQVVRGMHVKLKTTIPKDIDAIEDRDERNYWKIVQGVDEWFDLNLLPKEKRQGNQVMLDRDDDGKIQYYDAKEEHVQGLRNILNDIGANPLIRRVLFGHSDFDFDRHLEIGGVLLVNTAKGELVKLAQVLGKVVLMNLQSATFRREPIVSPYHHILVDEAPDYLYNSFREFPAQSRKYKVILTTLQQTIAQMADQFGEHYMTTIIAAMRNRMVYGDLPGYDAKYFSDMFGEKFVYQEGQSEMSVSPLQQDPVSRSGSTYSKVREQAYTGGDLMYQEAFQCAVKITVDNKPMKVVQIQANFVPREEFEQAKVTVDEAAAPEWLDARRGIFHSPLVPLDMPLQSVEETEKEFVQTEKEIEKTKTLSAEDIERLVQIKVDKHPRKEVTYIDREETVKQTLEELRHIGVSDYDEPVIDMGSFAPEPAPTSVEPPEQMDVKKPVAAMVAETYDESVTETVGNNEPASPKRKHTIVTEVFEAPSATQEAVTDQRQSKQSEETVEQSIKGGGTSSNPQEPLRPAKSASDLTALARDADESFYLDEEPEKRGEYEKSTLTDEHLDFARSLQGDVQSGDSKS